MQFGDVLSEIYGNDDSAVIAFELSGEILWKNNAAELLLGNSEISANEVLAAIKMSGRDNGSLLVSGGGCFRKVSLCGQELFIAEVYSLDRLAGAFGTPFFGKFISNSNTQTRQAVTGISAYCENINRSIEQGDNTRIPSYLDNIISSCCRLLRNTDVSVLLAKAVSEKNLREELIYLPDFIKNLSAGCAATMGNDHCEQCMDVPDCFVRTDRELFMYFILMLARRVMIHKSMKLHFGASADGQTVEITVCSEETGDVSESEKIGNIEGTFDKAYDIIAEKLGAEYTLAPNRAAIKLKCAQYNGEIVLESDGIIFGDSLFSPCRVMLSDLTDFRNFY